ncbi:SRPBCC domain-containing protein [Cryobacterium sp. PH31-AA6]|uniref:SRPBCC family protein n=1 Tax=Cryobacterium sp. PH31-AA6 TaxID=3046205 RepID=UPI0024B9E909|nr:SRPBCC domain-containing protein [Cryobacterium sp. PH31-AA6]MDJ0324722.1 SRPBCC domain-containing protein [Cryobacterium sp. PH31-AA6]
MTDSTSPNAVVIERIVDAPTDLVWRMWTEAEHFAAWYGPTGATIPVATMDVVVGGTRLVCMEMQTPNGTMKMWFTGEYLEIVENKRLVYTESMSDEHGTILDPAVLGMPADQPTTTEITVELDDLGTQTRMVMTHAGIPADSPGAMGWNMAFDKLATYLSTPH